MSYIKTIIIPAVAAALMLGVQGGELDLVQDIQNDFTMGLFARQDQQGQLVGLTNLNIFTGALGGSVAPPITFSTDPQHPYVIHGEPVSDFNSAIDKTCSIQHNNCSDLANSNPKPQFDVPDCDAQQNQCRSVLQTSATQTAFLTRETSSEGNLFDCEN
ncbi:hypothetical protein F4678DRAFT_430530 [Xylaria arbuscula]|nr:hypothetical protein F4678DRAFT_430530 [Xylaria arbuscula]